MLQRILRKTALSRVPSVLSGYSKYSSTPKDNEESKIPVEEDMKQELKTENRAETLSRLLDEAATYEDVKNKEWATSPYPESAAIDPSLLEPDKPRIDPSETTIFIFPGQGIIRAGYVKKYMKFPNVKEIFEIANEILGYNLLKICLEGPQEKLNETRYNQPATVVSCLAALERLREDRPATFETCVSAAGYSVGELAALIFAGAISLEDGIRLVATRGTAMQYASSLRPQGMMSIQCTPRSQVGLACKDAAQWANNLGVDNAVCATAIYLCTETKILAGDQQALDYIAESANKYDLTKVQKLPVSGAFHTQLMEPALKSFKKVLNEIVIEEPRCIVYSNATGKRHTSVQGIKKHLIKQIIRPVKWEQIMHLLYARPDGTTYPRTIDVCSAGRMKTVLGMTNAKAANSCIVV